MDAELLFYLVVMAFWLLSAVFGKLANARKKRPVTRQTQPDDRRPEPRDVSLPPPPPAPQPPRGFREVVEEQLRELARQQGFPDETSPPHLDPGHRPTWSEHRPTASEHVGTPGEHTGTLGEHRGTFGEHALTPSEHRETRGEHRGTPGEHRQTATELIPGRTRRRPRRAVVAARTTTVRHPLDVTEDLREPKSLARAFVLKEVLGPPVGLREREGRW